MKFKVHLSSCLTVLLLVIAGSPVSFVLASPHAAILPPGPSHPSPGTFATPISDSTIDNQVSADWVDGIEHSLPNPNRLRQTIWTQNTPPAGGPLLYGSSPKPGIRHLRLGFNSTLTVGSILVKGGGEVSVLRPNVAYPGNLGDDSQWLPANRILDRVPSSAPVDADAYGLWILPSGTKTRAIRFTHNATAIDSSYAGVLGGAYILSGRFVNIAPQATVSASSNQAVAMRLTDERYNLWGAWDNGPTFSHAVTAATPEWIILSWPRPVSVAGLAVLWAGFNGGDVDTFSGPDDEKPQDAPSSAWHPIGQSIQLRNQYPRPLGVDWFDFGKAVSARAIRLRINQVTDEIHHPHLAGKTRNGTRVWLGELMALEPIQSDSLLTAIPPSLSTTLPKPPIPVRFTLDAPGFVSLVIDDSKGNRVRNLISNTWFEKGPITVWWDGTDDLSRNPDAAKHGIYVVPTHFVQPGEYTVHGLYHGAIDLRYEFSIYSPGHPPWETLDTKGGWLTNHTPPSAALFVPAERAPGGKPLVYIGSYISEGGAGLAWVDLDGNKRGGRGWIGGAWTAAPFLTADSGPQADQDAYAYVGAPTGNALPQPGKPLAGVVRLTALTKHGDKAILNYSFDPGAAVKYGPDLRIDWSAQMGGLAAHSGLLVVSLPLQNQLLFVDSKAGKSFGTAPLADAHGLTFSPDGHLLVLSGKRLLRFAIPNDLSLTVPLKLAQPEVLVSDGLENPSGITTDPSGKIYVSDQGSSNQVHVFSESGYPLRSIGHPGPSQAGPYEPLHMNHPAGLAIDSSNHLWVTEADFQPKRVSIWTLDGKLVKAFYGPAEYGGGGSLDPRDKTKFYYHGMEFKLDWNSGDSRITNILYRPGDNDIASQPTMKPTTVLYSNEHRYFVNSYLGHATNGVTIGMLYLDKNGVISPVAAIGKANDWPLLQSNDFKSKLPPGADLSSRSSDKSIMFSWSDTNENGKVDPEEVQFLSSTSGSIVIDAILEQPSPATHATAVSNPYSPAANGPVILNSFVNGQAVRYLPTHISPSGIPTYDLTKAQVIANGAQMNASDGGGQILESSKSLVLTTAPLPFSNQGLGGMDAQHHAWSYPSLWPGLHPSHSAPLPDHPGELIGTTHLLGSFVSPLGSQVEPLWAINGNNGDIFLFTADGLFVSQLFQDGRTGKQWDMPVATRNMLVNDLTLHQENFFPSMTQTSDGNVYLVDGSHTSIVRVDGLNTLRTIPDSSLRITAEDIQKSSAYLKQRELSRQGSAGGKTLQVVIRSGAPPALNELVNVEKSSDWAIVDSRISQQGWNQKPDIVDAAITIAGGRLFAAFRTSEPNLLVNSGAVPNAPFKTGGSLDLMIGTDPAADPQRSLPVAGDIRLLVYQVSGKTRATLYRAVVPGTTSTVPFSSPARTITLDRVDDVSDVVELYSANGNYAFSIPLSTLGLKPADGQKVKADIGILRGNGTQTAQRAYWSDKATGITSDVPSEAEFSPALWGQWKFAAEEVDTRP